MNKLQSYLPNYRTLLLMLISVLIVYGISFYKRLADYRFWMANSQDYVVGEVVAMMDMDSYYWLKMAQELDEGHLEKGRVDSLKGYPDRVPFALQGKPSLLAEFISFGKNFTGGNYYRSGLLLIPLLAGLFVFPLFVYFQRLGFGPAAVLGGLIGSFSTSYYVRTMMGRVDTDLLNIFFPLAAACFILPMSLEKSWRANLALAIGAGLCMYLFTWWYQQPSFILVYLFFLLLYLLLGRFPWKQALLIALVFLVACGPEFVQQSVHSLQVFIRAYIAPPPTGRIAWPNIMNMIIEAKKRGVMETLQRIHGFLPMIFTGFTGLAYLYLRRFKQMIPVTPLLLLGVWSLMGPSRFAMYLAPLIGVGVGVLIELMLKFSAGKIGLRSPLPATLASIVLMFVLFFSTVGYTAYNFDSPPIISAPETKAILDIKNRVPEHSAMFTPFWEFGYPLMAIGDFATYQDGGLQGGLRMTLSAKAMMSTDQQQMVSLLSYLEDNGFNHLGAVIRKEKLSGDQLMDLVFNYPKPFQGKNVYVLYLQDMLWKVSPMSNFGTWDFNRKRGTTTDYVQLNCYALKNNVMSCMDGTIDLNRGVMNDGTVDIPLRAAVFVNDGFVFDQKSYQDRGDEGYYLQVLMKNNKIKMILVADERLFSTNFNQQYLLGNFDRRYFEEVYNDVPLARVLKVKRGAVAPTGTQ